MKLFSYVVARDYGFAPNPFYGVCTLATCKPKIRNAAKNNDWIIGTGCAGRSRKGFLVYAMQVNRILTFNEYWDDPLYQTKKPNLRGSKKQAFGDNIYFKDSNNTWHQQNSHHSYEDGSPNLFNVANDTQADRVLIGNNYIYCGGNGPAIPQKFRDYAGNDICAGRGHKCVFPESMVSEFIKWLNSSGLTGYQARPLDWSRTP